MANDFNLPPGPLSAYLGVRSANQQAGALDTENSARLMGILMQAQRAKQDALTNPLGLQLLQSQLNQRNLANDQAAREAAVFSPQNIAANTTPGRAAIELPPELAGPVAPAQAPQVNVNALRLQSALSGPRGFEAFNQHISQERDREAAREQRLSEIEQRGEQEIRNIRTRAEEGRITKEEADARERSMREYLAKMLIASRPERQAPEPIKVQDANGNVKLYDRGGNLIKDLGAVAAPAASVTKAATARQKLGTDISRAITELESATAEGGLIDKSTGSGIGAMVDMAAGFVGHGTEGAIAAGELAPIYDLVLKMVPRFEGPQSDKDTLSYNKAAGQLANPAVPNSIKKSAGKTILRLMKARQAQFISKDMAGTEADVPPSGPAKPKTYNPATGKIE